MRVHSQRDKNLKNYPEFVPDEMLSEEMADTNHGQTLSRLNERGGMSVPEILNNIHKRKNNWSPGAWAETQEKIDELNNLITQYINQQNKEG